MLVGLSLFVDSASVEHAESRIPPRADTLEPQALPVSAGGSHELRCGRDAASCATGWRRCERAGPARGGGAGARAGCEGVGWDRILAQEQACAREDDDGKGIRSIKMARGGEGKGWRGG